MTFKTCRGGGNSRNPQVSPQGFPQPPIIASGHNDVVVGGTPEKKSRKGVVILIALVIILILVGVAYLLWQNTGSGEREDASSQVSVNLQEKYNSYVNYVLWGEENMERPDAPLPDNVGPYFTTIEGAAFDDYDKKASAKFVELKDALDGGRVDLEPLAAYFQDYAKTPPMFEDELFRIYVEGGREALMKKADERFATLNEDGQMANYVSANLDFVQLYAELIAEADNAGCVKEGTMVKGCYNVSEENILLLADKKKQILVAIEALRASAMEVIEKIYTILYGASPEMAVNVGGEKYWRRK